MSKQDRQGVRSPTDLERKYDLKAIAGLKKAAKVSEEGINKTNKILEEFVATTLQSFENIESQIDGNIATHFYDGVPTLENVPASEWTTDEDKKNHLSDLYYDKDSGKVYEFVFTDEEYYWKETESNAIIEAMALANAAKDTADGKRRIFTKQPIPPYDFGDLWFNEEEIFICDNSKLAGDSYEDGDFVTATKYTDDSVANEVKVDLSDFMGKVEAEYSTTVEMNSAITKSEGKITTSVNKTITENVNMLQQQIDGAIETYTGSTEPTLENTPASEWTTDEEKDTHIGDLYIVNSDGGDLAGFYYRFEKTDTLYRWTLLKDNEVTKALQDAKDANEKAEEIRKNLEENYSNTTEMRSEIKQAAEEVNVEVAKKVGSDEVIAKINMTPETIKILAECIDVDGVLDVEKLNSLQIKAGSVDAENITGTRLTGKEFVSMSRNKLDEDVAGLYIGEEGLDYCWDVSASTLEDGTFAHFRVSKSGCQLIVNSTTLFSFTGSSRFSGNNLGYPYVYIPNIVYETMIQNDEM